VIEAYNAIAQNTAGGTDVVADGPGSTITLSRSNYRAPSSPEGGVVQDAPGEPHQTALPLFTNPATFDFSELASSPTVDAGLSDPLNGPVDFAGNPRSLGGGTDIGAYEFVPPTPVAPAAAPTFALGRTKVKVNRKGKGRLPFTCTSPTGEQCIVAGKLSAGGKAASRNLGQVSGTVPGASTGNVQVKLNKAGRKRLAAKRKLRASLSGQVSNATGQISPLTASLTLKPKR
jgi:hypothetical protein